MIQITKRPDGRIGITTPFGLKDVCKALPGRRWDPKARQWHLPATPASASNVIDVFTLNATTPDLLPVFPDFLTELAGRGGQAEELRMYTGDLPAIPSTKFKPWSNQLRGYHMITRQTATFLAWEMGTGKTKPIVDAITNLDGISNSIVLCPTSVVPVWPKEFAKHCVLDNYHVCALTKGSVAKRTQQAVEAMKYAQDVGKRCIIVINYEAAWRPAFAKWSLGVKWDMVIADESHRIKSPGGKASKYLAKLGENAGRRVCLTGTPMPHSPLDVFAQYRFLDPAIYGTSFTAFRARYAIMGGFENRQVLRYVNMDDLHKKFYSIADRVQKTDVLDLPEFVHEERIIELPAKSMKIYKDLEADMIADVGAGVVTASNALSRLLRLHQITSGFTVTEDDLVVDLNTAKQDALADLLANEIEPGTPVVVFCLFRKDLAAVHMAAAEAKCQSVELSGSRHDINGTWDDGPDTVAAIQIAAGGIGIDLTRSSVNVYYSIGFNGGDYEQSLARSHRNGQTNKVTYIHFIVEDTIDRRIQLALARRASIVKDVLAQLENKL